jgi:hypothetical protein
MYKWNLSLSIFEFLEKETINHNNFLFIEDFAGAMYPKSHSAIQPSCEWVGIYKKPFSCITRH